MREAALTERADTLEHETLHWRQRCAPLRDRCAELEDEVGVLRTTRAAEKEAVELAKRKQIEAEADAVSARAAWHGANEAAREARAQAQRYFDDSEGRWLRQGLSVMLSKVFEVIEMPQEVQQKMYSAKDGEELTVASDAFIAGITEREVLGVGAKGEERELGGRRRRSSKTPTMSQAANTRRRRRRSMRTTWSCRAWRRPRTTIGSRLRLR